METLPSKIQFNQDSVRNVENGYPVTDLNKIMINVTKDPSETHIKTLKEEILEDITKKFVDKVLDIINQNVQEISRHQK
jgi:hypothetical protein